MGKQKEERVYPFQISFNRLHDSPLEKAVLEAEKTHGVSCAKILKAMAKLALPTWQGMSTEDQDATIK